MNEWCFSVQRGFCQHSRMIIGKTAHCLTNGMTAQKFIFTLGMERSRVLDKGEIRRLNNGRERKLAQGGKNPGQQLHYPGQ